MNSNRDIVFKRCGCTREDTGRQLAGCCPHLPEPGHGSWYYAVQVTTVVERKARYRRGGFPTREAAVTARQALLETPADRVAAGAWTLARWLRYWLKLAEPHLRPSTIHGYRDHIYRYLIPSLGQVILADLTARRLQACFDLLARQRTGKGTPVAPATVDRVRALASHTDLKVIQQMLGHSSIITTADTYTSVLPEAAHRAAQATADMIIQAAAAPPAPGSASCL